MRMCSPEDMRIDRYTLYFLLQANKLASNISSESHELGGSEHIPEGQNRSWIVDTIRFHDGDARLLCPGTVLLLCPRRQTLSRNNPCTALALRGLEPTVY